MRQSKKSEPLSSLSFPEWLRQGVMVEILRDLVPDPTAEHALVARLVAVVDLDGWFSGYAGTRGRPRLDRKTLARAFLAKFVLRCIHTEDLRRRLMGDAGLRASIGLKGGVPSSSTFSRAFAEFAESELSQKAHEALVMRACGDQPVWHLARDSTAIAARERPSDKRSIRVKKRSRQQAQLDQDALQALRALPDWANAGTKRDSKGFPQWWRGYKLHADVDDRGLPITVALTSASLHDSQVAIPLMRISATRAKVFYQLMDCGYMGKPILQAAEQLEQVALLTPRATSKAKAIPLEEDRQRRMKHRTVVERFFANLKDNFLMAGFRYRGPLKVRCHVMFAVLALAASIVIKAIQREL